ncbi:hypothetical protein WR25_24719 isoform E [Diploscapter pachys]|uniref:Uncharacterized protein n=1 Tax=Diploscapter pachys TaxID=2018661 RepID=A0A2A2L996_9BILA|nr:hypothetical protein WR25_24719 isoform E [Diploscapter pachys]
MFDSDIKRISSTSNNNQNIRDAIAIDIGTSKCRISICKDQHVQIVEHESNRAVPTYVARSEQGDWLVGKLAENYSVSLPSVAYDIRWLTEKTYADVNYDKEYLFNFAKHKSPTDLVIIELPLPKEAGNVAKEIETQFYPSRLLSILLITVLKTAFGFVNNPSSITVTIPLGSDSNYRDRIKDILRHALNKVANPDIPSTTLIRLIEEPTAVVASYAHRLNLHPKGDVVLSFCMGSGYLQAELVYIQKKTDHWTIHKIPDIQAVYVENKAGNYIDQLIFEYLMKIVRKRSKNKSLRLSPKPEKRLRIACEKLKCALSFAPHTRVDVDSLYRNKAGQDCDLLEVVQRQDVEQIYDKIISDHIGKIVRMTGVIQPKFILMGGGSTRIPKINEYLQKNFKDSKIGNFMNVDEVASTGAATIASDSVMVAEPINSPTILKLIKDRKEVSTSPEKEIIMNTKDPIPKPQDSMQEVRTNQNSQNDERIVEQPSRPITHPPTVVPTESRSTNREDVASEEISQNPPTNSAQTQIIAHMNQEQRNHAYFPTAMEKPNHYFSNPQIPSQSKPGYEEQKKIKKNHKILKNVIHPTPDYDHNPKPKSDNVVMKERSNPEISEPDYDEKPKPENISVIHPVVMKILVNPAPDYEPTKKLKNNDVMTNKQSNPEISEPDYEKTESEDTRVVNPPIMKILANLKPDYEPIKKPKTNDMTMKEQPKPEENTPIMSKIEPTEEKRPSSPSIIAELKQNEGEISSKRTETIANDRYPVNYTHTPIDIELMNVISPRSPNNSYPRKPTHEANGDILDRNEIQYPNADLPTKSSLPRNRAYGTQAYPIPSQSSVYGHQLSPYSLQYSCKNAQGYSLPINISYSNPKDHKYTERAEKKTNKHRNESEKTSAKKYKDSKPEIKPEKLNWTLSNNNCHYIEIPFQITKLGEKLKFPIGGKHSKYFDGFAFKLFRRQLVYILSSKK